MALRLALEFMTLNITELESVIPEIQLAVRGSILTGVESPDQWTCILSFSSVDGGPVKRVFFSRRPRLTRLNLLPDGWTSPAQNIGRRSIEAVKFVDAVSRALKGAEAGPMRTRFRDRVVSMEMYLPKDSGRSDGSDDQPVRMFLLFECTGMHANLFLLDERQVIQAVFGRSTSRRRPLDVGCRYQQPAEIEGPRPVGRRVDVMRFVRSDMSLGHQISEMYDPLDQVDDRKRELSSLAEELSFVVEERRKVAESVRRDLAEPVRPGRPADLPERLRERLDRVDSEVRELQELLHGVRKGDVSVFDRATELVTEYRAKIQEIERRRAERPARPDWRPREGGYQRRDDSPRPPREGGYKPREAGHQRRDDSPRPPREGGYKPREGGYQRRDDSPRPPREGGYKPREGGYQRRDDSPRPPREGGYKPREGGARGTRSASGRTVRRSK